ncbi:hypothetical protein [Paludisphaera rhizosphaerae]|uniref:hypothetical protein n=1 Tax=Paludisphaera rhizosphaerae TaxID=2711216 RepID=UPI0013EA3822|nr:hypothetical protein [Paludisphaera rhizosphaerae]
MSEPAYLTPAAAGRLFPSADGRGLSPQSVMRSILRGTQSVRQATERIKLRAVRTPAGWLTTAEWVAEYVDALTADRVGAPHKQSVEERGLKARALLRAKGW